MVFNREERPQRRLDAPLDVRDRFGELLQLGSGQGLELLVFLKAHCDGCACFFEAAAQPVGSGLCRQERLVLCLTELDLSLTEAVERAAPEVRVVVGAEPYRAFAVHSGPFFVLLDASSRTVLTEGVAWSVPQVREHLDAALAGEDRSVPRLRAGG